MLKKLQVPLCALAFSLCLLLAGCATSSYEGTWYCIQDDGSELVLTLDENGTCYATNGMGGNWEKTEGGFIITTSYSPLVFQDGEDGTITTIAEPNLTFSKDPEQVCQLHEAGKQAEADECTRRFEEFEENIKTNLVGTWQQTTSSSATTISFFEDGTWSCTKGADSSKGTWITRYDGDMSEEYKASFAKVLVLNEVGNEDPRFPIWLKEDGAIGGFAARDGYEKIS